MTPKPQQSTGELTILTIRQNSEGPKPLRVTFRLDSGEPIDADFSASEIETFASFRRSVANRFGLWPRHWCEGRGRDGRAQWNREIECGFRRGEAESP